MLFSRYFLFISKTEEIEFAHFELGDKTPPLQVNRQGSRLLFVY
jgi:hypothetical protein